MMWKCFCKNRIHFFSVTNIAFIDRKNTFDDDENTWQDGVLLIFFFILFFKIHKGTVCWIDIQAASSNINLALFNTIKSWPVGLKKGSNF